MSNFEGDLQIIHLKYIAFIINATLKLAKSFMSQVAHEAGACLLFCSVNSPWIGH